MVLVLGMGLAPFPGDSGVGACACQCHSPQITQSHPCSYHPAPTTQGARAQGAKSWHPDGLPKAKNGVPVEAGASLDCLFHILCCQGRPLVFADVLLLCSIQEVKFFTLFGQGSVSFLLLFWASLRLGGVISSPQLAAPTEKPWTGASRRRGEELRYWVLMFPSTGLQLKGLNSKIPASLTVAAGRCLSGARV